jgi:hypothetical protein
MNKADGKDRGAQDSQTQNTQTQNHGSGWVRTVIGHRHGLSIALGNRVEFEPLILIEIRRFETPTIGIVLLDLKFVLFGS